MEMVKENDLVAIFNSIHRVMKAEKILKEARADILLIPVPRKLSSDCGLAIRFAPDQRTRVAAILRDQDLLPAEIFQRRGEEFQPAEPMAKEA